MSKREIIDVVFEEVFPKYVHNYKNETSQPEDFSCPKDTRKGIYSNKVNERLDRYSK